MTRKQILFRLESDKSDLFDEKLKEMNLAKQDFFCFIVDAFLRDEISIDLSSQSLSQQADFSDLQLTNAVMKISENSELLKAISSALKPYLIKDNTIPNNRDNKSDSIVDNQVENDPNLTNPSLDNNNNTTGDSSLDNKEDEPNLINVSFDNNKDSIRNNSSETIDDNWQDSKTENIDDLDNKDDLTLIQSSINFDFDNNTDSIEGNQVGHEDSLTDFSADSNKVITNELEMKKLNDSSRAIRLELEKKHSIDNDSDSLSDSKNEKTNQVEDNGDNSRSLASEPNNRRGEDDIHSSNHAVEVDKSEQFKEKLAEFKKDKGEKIPLVDLSEILSMRRQDLTKLAKKERKQLPFPDFWDYVECKITPPKKKKGRYTYQWIIK